MSVPKSFQVSLSRHLVSPNLRRYGQVPTAHHPFAAAQAAEGIHSRKGQGLEKWVSFADEQRPLALNSRQAPHCGRGTYLLQTHRHKPDSTFWGL